MLNQPDELRDFIHNQASTCPLPYGHSAGTSPNIRTKTKANATTTTRNNSVKDVEQTMNEMDRLNSTSFASWVRSEKVTMTLTRTFNTCAYTREN